jgi:hypothetical protein
MGITAEAKRIFKERKKPLHYTEITVVEETYSSLFPWRVLTQKKGE